MVAPSGMEIVELRNDVVYDPVAVRVRGYQLVLDPQAYTVEMRIRLTPQILEVREERAMKAAVDALPEDAPRDDRDEAEVLAQAQFWADLLNGVLHPPLHVERARDLNPEWTAERLIHLLDVSDMAQLIFFFRRLGTGETKRSMLSPLPAPQQEEPPSQESSTGDDSSTSSAKPTRPTRARKS